MRLKAFEKEKKIYFIGIGGISMSSLAKFLSVCGYEVSGSDEVRSEETDALAFYGIRVFIGVDGERKGILEADVIVYTDAISLVHEELLFAKRLGKKIYARADFLGLLCEEFSKVISVAGSHGKTTCTAMCAHVLKYLRSSFTAHIGGIDDTFGNFYTTGREFFVTEACEFKKNLLKIKTDVAILLNVDKDHMECYDGEADLQNTFHRYCDKAKTAFVCADDAYCRTLNEYPSFGIHSVLADYRAIDIRANGERYSFGIEEYGKKIAQVKLNAIGRCNVYNALAAFAAIRSFGFDGKEIAKGLEGFRAVKRRFEKIGEYRGASFICDYAHHPREIASTIATTEGICAGKLYVVFQPHTYSRTKLLLKEFIDVLRPVENLMVYRTYSAREKYDEEGSAKLLAQTLGNCLYADDAPTLKTWLKNTLKEGDVVLFLGAGDIYYVAQYLLKSL